MKFPQKFMMLFVAVFMTTVASAQEKTKASPAATETGKINGANITINYSSPGVKERKIWGELVPYGKVWRAGANETTTIETDKALKIEGKNLPAGKYAVYVIPENNSEATVIFGKDSKMSASKYNAAQDQLRVKVKTKKSKATNERLAYKINKDNITLSWENLDIPVKVK